MDDESAPAPPDGYRRYDPEEEMGWSQSDIFEIIAVLWPIMLLALMGISYTSAMIDRFFIILVLGVVAIVIHEGFHLVAAWVFGLDVTAGIDFKRFRPYVLTYGEFQSRFQTTIILSAPLALFTTFCIVAVFVRSSLGQPSAEIAILGVMNVVLAYYDILDLRFTQNLPEGTKEYHRKGYDVAYYVPEAIDTSDTGTDN